MALSKSTYKKLFVNSGLLGKEDFARAYKQAEETRVLPETVLVREGHCTDEQAGRLLADAYGVPFVNLKRVKADPRASKVVPEPFAHAQGVVAYGLNGALRVAMLDPQNAELVGYLEKKAGTPVEVGYTTPGLMEAFLDKGTDTEGRIKALVDGFEKSAVDGKSSPREEEDEGLVVKLADLVFRYGFENGASDVHIEPRDKDSLLRYRIDGVLHDMLTMPKPLHEKVLARIKILSNLPTDEHFAAQDGKFRFAVNEGKIDLRVSIMPVVGGEKAVLRLLTQHGQSFTLESLGLERKDLEKAKRAALRPYGMILSTGPTGSGKTTTLYAVLKILNRREVNVQTIEDPVEYDIEGINQIQVNPRTNLTFAQGLRSIVRQDPDIIMVGEIRDQETAAIAVNAAMTGHLLLSTLHTNDAATALPRLLDMGVEPFLVASSVNLIIAQRLVRKLCRDCVTSETVKLADLAKNLPSDLVERVFGNKPTVRLYKGKGCERCHDSGYSGRLGIFEVLEITNSIRDLIVNHADAAALGRKAIEEGMTTMIEDGLRKVAAGITTVEEVLRVSST